MPSNLQVITASNKRGAGELLCNLLYNHDLFVTRGSGEHTTSLVRYEASFDCRERRNIIKLMFVDRVQGSSQAPPSQLFHLHFNPTSVWLPAIFRLQWLSTTVATLHTYSNTMSNTLHINESFISENLLPARDSSVWLKQQICTSGDCGLSLISTNIPKCIL